MTLKSRRPSRDEVHASIIQTARDIAATKGWPCVTVRKVAESIGYTAPIIYEHFGSKDVMLTEILIVGYADLLKALSDIADKEPDPAKCLRAMAIAYWEFAHEAPELYQLMYGLHGACISDNNARMPHAAPVAKLLADTLRRYNPERINESNAYVHMVEVWSMFLGLISLDLNGNVACYAVGCEVLETMIEDMLCALGQPLAGATS
jgi:AcrR family transcriptional regulator